MNTNIHTLIASVTHNVKLRDAIGVNNNPSFSIYNTLLKFIKYCKSKSDVKYTTYGSILQDKLTKLQSSCNSIKPRKITEIEYINLPDVDLTYPVGDIVLNYSDLVPSHIDVSEIRLYSSDYTINGRSDITILPFTSITLRSSFRYYSIDSDTVAEVSRNVDDNLTALGYYVDYTENSELFYTNGTSRVSVKCNILESKELYSIIKFNVFSYNKEERRVSNEVTVRVKLTNEVSKLQTSDSEVVYEELKYNITDTPNRRFEVLPFSGKSFYIENLHSIESKSAFLEIKNDKISLSSSYEYFISGASVIAVPKEVVTLIESGYTITTYENGYLDLSRINTSGNKESIILYTFNITNSLYINYRVKEDTKEPSNITSIAYKIDVSSVPTDSIINSIFVGYD